VKPVLLDGWYCAACPDIDARQDRHAYGTCTASHRYLGERCVRARACAPVTSQPARLRASSRVGDGATFEKLASCVRDLTMVRRGAAAGCCGELRTLPVCGKRDVWQARCVESAPSLPSPPAQPNESHIHHRVAAPRSQFSFAPERPQMMPFARPPASF